MLFPEEDLRRGGKFYLCWVADCWPGKFAQIKPRQLWAQDIRDICQDLEEVIVVEGRQATTRFSLRLSSQLLRGIVRLYQRKVNTYLGELCKMDAEVMKAINEKYSEERREQRQRRVRIVEVPDDVFIEEPDDEEQVEERLLNSGNVVANIDDITLREDDMPAIQQPIDYLEDNFGEEYPEQGFELLNDRTLEMMLGTADVSGAQFSGLDVQLGISDNSIVSYRQPPKGAVMEWISGHEPTSRKSTAIGDITMPAEEMEKDMPPIPTDLPVPSPPKQARIEALVVELSKDVVEEPARQSDESLHLQEPSPQVLAPPQRRRVSRLIIDEQIEITSDVMQTRLAKVAIALRCEDTSDDLVDPYRLFSANYFKRPAHTGWRMQARLAAPLDSAFQRNLAPRPNYTSHKKQEVASADDTTEPIHPELQLIEPAPELVLKKQRVTNVEDISDMPTQVLATQSLGHKAKTRQAAELELVTPAKRPRACGVFKMSLIKSEEERSVRDIFVPHKLSQEAGPETVRNIIEPEEQEQEAILPFKESYSGQPSDQQVTQLLQQAGLAEGKKAREDVTDDSSETQLGSLDRTEVDLGESEDTTDLQRLKRNEWGTEGIMCKILHLIRRGVSPLTVKDLVEFGPSNNEPKAMIAVRVFTSLLKLKTHKIIDLEKDETNKITNILMGEKLQQYNM